MKLENLLKGQELVKLIEEKEKQISLIEQKIDTIRRSSIDKMKVILNGQSEELNFKISKKVIIREGNEELYVLRNQVKALKYNFEKL